MINSQSFLQDKSQTHNFSENPKLYLMKIQKLTPTIKD
jgi:hypothetical protein